MRGKRRLVIMNTPKSVLKIRQHYSEFRGKNRKIADYILENPKKIAMTRIKEVSIACGCDDAMVVRFCKNMGYSGFSGLRMSITAELLPPGLDFSGGRGRSGGSFEAAKKSFLENNSRVLCDTVESLSESDIIRAAELISKAGKVCLLAAGASGIVALDAQVKLLRMGFNAIFHQDSEFSGTLAGLCTVGDVILAVSFSGKTKSVCGAARDAAGKGAGVISVTNYPHSPLVRLSDIAFFTASDERPFRLGAMNSRLAQLYILDFLIVNIALKGARAGEDNDVFTDDARSGRRKRRAG